MNTIDDKKLEEVTGGKDRKAFRFTCPNCKESVPVSYQQLLSSDPIICPYCNHSFQVDPQYSPLLDYSDLPQEKPEDPTLTKLK